MKGKRAYASPDEGVRATPPFGEILKQTTSGTVKDNYLYTGKEWKDVSGVNLTYFGARWYDATVGRFLQTDPAGEGPNAYSLALNNPLTGVDRWGLQTENHHAMVGSAGGWRSWLEMIASKSARMALPNDRRVRNNENWLNGYMMSDFLPTDYDPFSMRVPEDLVARNSFMQIPGSRIARRNGQIGYWDLIKVPNANAGSHLHPDGRGMTVISDYHYEEVWNAGLPGDIIIHEMTLANENLMPGVNALGAGKDADFGSAQASLLLANGDAASSYLSGINVFGHATSGPDVFSAERTIGAVQAIYRPVSAEIGRDAATQALYIINKDPGFDPNYEWYANVALSLPRFRRHFENVVSCVWEVLNGSTKLTTSGSCTTDLQQRV